MKMFLKINRVIVLMSYVTINRKSSAKQLLGKGVRAEGRTEGHPECEQNTYTPFTWSSNFPHGL